jgi:cellulose synthase/poly-beta-1,6-N-acetylglucosamine synthase-like glycosyltransferase
MLRRAVASVCAQRHPPAELLVISHADDLETKAITANLNCEIPHDVDLRLESVYDVGFLPPIRAAIVLARGDIVAFLDDDSEAHSDWLENMIRHYADPAVGGVGGRCVNFFAGVEQKYALAFEFGRLLWYGKTIGNMYRDAASRKSRDVDFLMGGNMSYRRALLERCVPDMRLNNNVAFHWELDVGLQMRRLGYRIVFDPDVVTDHHTGPRIVTGMRSANYEGIYWSNFNYARIMRRHLSPPRLGAFLVYTSLLGYTFSPGIGCLVLSFLRFQKIAWREVVWPSIRGRWDGLNSVTVATHRAQERS